MGALLTLLQKEQAVSTEVFVDFENAKPTESEQDIYNTVSQLMTPTVHHLKTLKGYAGCGEQIRKAISSPGKETEEAAWAAVCPAVAKLKEFYEFSSTVETCFSKLLSFLFDGKQPVKASLERNQATANLFARLLTFALDFDDLKMTNPSIQNDFSYYRRTLNRMKMTKTSKELLDSAVVKDELANRMSLFYAYPTPMLKTLVDRLTGAQSASAAVSRPPTEQITEGLSLMVAICHVAVTQNSFAQQETLYFCLRVMVACIILFDHIDSRGVFHKDSEINIKTHIKLIQSSGDSHAESLLNAIRYTTKHLNDESTPKSVKALLI